MSKYEIITTIVSLIACLISLSNWFGQRKLQQESNDLQRATSELARKQLEMILKEENNNNKSHVILKLIRERNLFKFKIENISNVVAKDVHFDLIIDKKNNPIPINEYESKLPIKMLQSKGSITLIAALTFSTPTSYNAILKWTNPDGSITEEETFVSL